MATALEETKAGRLFDTWLREQMADSVPCEFGKCDTEATWRMIMPCCREGVNFCTPHKKMQDEVLSISRVIRCVLCGASGLDPNDVRLVEL